TPPAVRTHPMAAAALADARLDLELRRLGLGLLEAIGATPRPLPRTAVVGRAPDLDALVAAVAERVASGAAMVKLKVDPDWAVRPVRAVRDRWPTLRLAVDANGSLRGHRWVLEE